MLSFKFPSFSIRRFFTNYQVKTSHIKNFLKFYTQNFFSTSKFYNRFHDEKIKKKLFSKHKFILIGGGKKRKKKNYTKPKKIKHVRKTLKLRVLNYYSITEGKIKKLKKDSPHVMGCFMAHHSDRWTCGRTGLTITHYNGTKKKKD